jgi:hypothetical protein
MDEFPKKCLDAGAHVHQTKPYSPWQDHAEWTIRELKKKTRRVMMQTRCPKQLWDDCLGLMADINSHSVHDNHDLHGQTPQAIITGETPDIARLAEFLFYE